MVNRRPELVHPEQDRLREVLRQVSILSHDVCESKQLLTAEGNKRFERHALPALTQRRLHRSTLAEVSPT
ncbi:hypothetical protein NODU109028_09550 [Nocardioides dubius]